MESQQLDKFKKMTTAPVNKLVLSLAVPTIISMLVTSFYNMADTYFVSKISTSATGAVGIVFSVMAIIQAFGFFFGQGSGNFISRMLGNKNEKDASKMATTALVYSFCFGVLITVVGLIFISPIATLLGSTETILPYAIDYMQYILIGAPFITCAFTLNNQLRFQGNSFYAMIAIVSGAVINIGLDPVFIFVFNMGTGGAALATVISQVVSFCLLFLGTTKGGNVRIKLRNFSFNKKYIAALFQCGTPSLCRQGIASVGSIALNVAAGVYGDAAIAAMSVVTKVMMFLSSAVIGFGQGFQPVCGFNYGAGLYNRVRKAFWFCVKLSTVFLVAVATLSIIFAPQIILFFVKDDPKVLEIGTQALRAQMLSFVLFGWVCMCNMSLQNLGKVFRATFLSVARQGVFFIPLILILPYFFGLEGVIITQPVADLLTFFVSLPMQLAVLKELKNKQSEQKKLNYELK